MADDTVVSIGAKIDGVLSALGQVNSQLSGMSAAAQKVNDSFMSLAKTAAGALGLGLTLSAMKSFVTGMGEAGLHAAQLKAQLGETSEGMGKLKAISKLTGVDMDSMAVGINRLSLNVQTATKDSFSPQAQALKVLGLSTKELIGLNASDYFEKFATAAGKLNPSLNLTNALVTIGGRSMLQMLPALLAGKNYLEEWSAKITAVRYGLEGFGTKALDTNNRLVVLTSAIDAAQKRIFLALKPAIDLIVDSLTKFFAALDAKKIQEWSVYLVEKMGSAVVYMITLFDSFGMKVDEVLTKIKRVLLGVAIGGTVGLFGAGPLGAIIGASVGGMWATFMESFSTGEKKAEDKVSEDGAKLIAKVKAMVDSLKAAMTGAVSSGTDSKTGKSDAAAMNLTAKTGIEMVISRINGEIALLQGALARKNVLYQLDADMWKTTEQTKLQRSYDAAQEAYAVEVQKLTQIRDLWPRHTKEWEEANRKMLQASQSFATQLIQINADMARDIKSKLDDVSNQFQSSFNSQMRGLLAGTTTWKQAFKSVLGDMIIYAIQAVEKMLANWLTGQLAMVAISTSAESAKTSAAAAGATARTSIDVGAALTGIGTALAETYAKMVAWYTTVFGPAAPAAAAATVAGIGAIAYGMIKGYAVGTDYVPQTGLAMLHQGEAVIPAEDNRGGSGDTYQINITAMDGADVKRMFMKHGSTIVDSLSRQRRVGKAMLNPMGA